MAKQALTMPGLDGNPQFQSIVARIRAREKERQEISDKLQQGAEAVADPRESRQGFETLFAERRSEIERLLAAPAGSDSDAQSIGQRLDALDEARDGRRMKDGGRIRVAGLGVHFPNRAPLFRAARVPIVLLSPLPRRSPDPLGDGRPARALRAAPGRRPRSPDLCL